MLASKSASVRKNNMLIFFKNEKFNFEIANKKGIYKANINQIGNLAITERTIGMAKMITEEVSFLNE